MCKSDCNCQKEGPKINLKAHEHRTESFDGRQHLVIPVIMAREDVVMNEALLPSGEMFAAAWNGVPVTIGHPSDGEDFLSANSPRVIEEWCAGRIFNASVVDGVLKGEAWIDVAKLNKLDRDLIRHLKEIPIDVSTGYFADAEPSVGELNGREYKMIHRNVRPDHLALLPGETGACSWENGCGVRTNRRTLMKDTKGAFLALAKAFGFVIEDKKLKANEEDLPKDQKDYDPEMEENEDEEKKDKEAAMTKEDVEKTVANAIAAALKAHAAAPAKLSAEDEAAVSFARNMIANQRTALVTKITSNSDMTEDQLKGFDMTALETIANGIRVVEADYSGRYIGNGAAGSDKKDDVAVAMETNGVLAHFKARNKKEAA
jgi:hypothetical protein